MSEHELDKLSCFLEGFDRAMEMFGIEQTRDIIVDRMNVALDYIEKIEKEKKS